MTKEEIQKQLEEIVKLFSKTNIDLTNCTIQELFDFVRVGTKDMLLNYEATTRENELLKKQIKE